MTISPVDQTTEHVWEETWIEVEKGWLRRSCEKNVMVGTELKEALTLVRNLVEQSKPLEINRSLCRTWIQSVFTDHTLAHPLNCRGGVVARLSA